MTRVSADEMARVLAGLRAAAPPPKLAAPYLVDAHGTALTEALGDPAAPRYPSPMASDDLVHRVRAESPYRCSVCGDDLDAVHSLLGTHPLCDPVPTPVDSPPSTVAELRGILLDFERSSERTQQTEIGPSEICVPCDRRLGYRLRGVPEIPDGRVKWAAMLGTAGHLLVADALRAENQRLDRERWLIEREVWPDPATKGHSDAYDVDHQMVVDWKFPGKTRLDLYRRKGPPPEYEGQGQLYGLGWQRAGLPVRFVRVVFLARASHLYDDSHEWTAPYSRRAAEAAMDRMYRVLTLTGDLGVGTDPARWAAMPALPGDDCKFCPYYRRGGPADATGCPGDVAADAARDAKFNDGLIPPTK